MDSNQKVPIVIHKHVKSLCSKIGTGTDPIFIEVHADPEARYKECFYNVAKKIKQDGGSIQLGWAIWEVPGLLIEGEFHAVWISPSGDFVDITPKEESETKILFLPDNHEVWQIENHRLRDNIRMPQIDHPCVHALISAAAEMHKYIDVNTYKDDPHKCRVDPVKLDSFSHRIVSLKTQMLSLKVGRNDLCRCGSGKKTKTCCMK